jgi:hypothetical protein
MALLALGSGTLKPCDFDNAIMVCSIFLENYDLHAGLRSSFSHAKFQCQPARTALRALQIKEAGHETMDGLPGMFDVALCAMQFSAKSDGT